MLSFSLSNNLWAFSVEKDTNFMKNSFNSISCFINGNCLLRNWQNSIVLPSEEGNVRWKVSKAFGALVTDIVLDMLMIYTSKSNTTNSCVILNDYLIVINQMSLAPNPYCQDWYKVFNFICILVKDFVETGKDYEQKLG